MIGALGERSPANEFAGQVDTDSGRPNSKVTR